MPDVSTQINLENEYLYERVKELERMNEKAMDCLIDIANYNYDKPEWGSFYIILLVAYFSIFYF